MASRSPESTAKPNIVSADRGQKKYDLQWLADLNRSWWLPYELGMRESENTLP